MAQINGASNIQHSSLEGSKNQSRALASPRALASRIPRSGTDINTEEEGRASRNRALAECVRSVGGGLQSRGPPAQSAQQDKRQDHEWSRRCHRGPTEFSHTLPTDRIQIQY